MPIGLEFIGEVDKALDMLNQCIEQTEEFYPLAKVVFLVSLGLGYAMAGNIDRAVKIVESQPLEEIKAYKEELEAIDSSQFSEDSLVSRWENRIFVNERSFTIPTVQVGPSKF